MRRKVALEDIAVGAVLISNFNEELEVEKVDIESNKVYYKINKELGRRGGFDYIKNIEGISSSIVGVYEIYSNQIGGKHYNKNDPIKFARDNYPAEQLEGFFRINVDKYVARYDKKNGLEDLKKAKHYLDMLISLKEQQDAE